jgi:hypothetical protein
MRSVSRCKRARAGRGLGRTGCLVGGFGILLGLGACGETAERPLTLISPLLEPCDRSRDPSCKDLYIGCAELKAERLTFEVGLFDTESTTVDCPAELSTGKATVVIRYRPGLSAYAVNTSYTREDELLNVAAGPFSENETATPWLMRLK